MTAAPDDVLAYERRLRRAADQHASDATDADLRRILSFVRDRRAQRVVPGARPAPTRAAAAPTGSAATAEVDVEAAVDVDGTTDETTGRIDPPAPTGLPGEVLAVEEVGPTVRILRVGRPAALRFAAGQHIKVGLPGTRRGKFSVASAPRDPHLELCVQLIPGGRLTPALFELRAGDRVEIGAGAKGRFQLHDGASTHLMVATGTGVAPFRSMLRDAAHRGASGRFVVVHGASHVDELPYLDELTAAPTVEYRPTVSRPNDPANRAWTGATGRADRLAATIAADLDPATTHVYACGNKGMVDAVTEQLGGLGFAVSREVYD